MTKYFSIAFLGPIEYFAHLYNSQKNIIEKHCNYTKQTYRNRCEILAANGPMSLSIPIDKQGLKKCLTKDIRISYDTPWQIQHWRSIESAYNSTPYFEYYQDDFRQFFEKNWSFLFDFNIQLMKVVTDAIGLEPNYTFSNSYENDINGDDLREVIHPKKDFRIVDPNFNPIEYRQIFSNKFGFVPNLSIIDLIFNKGPESLIILYNSLKKSDVNSF